MEIRGRIIAVLPAQGGVSGRTGNPWKKQEYVIEVQDRFPRKVCFQIFGEERINQAAIQEGEELTVHMDVESQEYQGRWFTRVTAWKVERGVAASSSSGQYTPSPVNTSVPDPEPQAYTATAGSKDDDLPF
ncbi:MAG: DUF3127 domain-containing protein [Tannerellaceae bacterium]|jgi:hypothetical protein|nr:DUF3127 domain-containing protein [Tannerellaceae bacterium]